MRAGPDTTLARGGQRVRFGQTASRVSVLEPTSEPLEGPGARWLRPLAVCAPAAPGRVRSGKRSRHGEHRKPAGSGLARPHPTVIEGPRAGNARSDRREMRACKTDQHEQDKIQDGQIQDGQQPKSSPNRHKSESSLLSVISQFDGLMIEFNDGCLRLSEHEKRFGRRNAGGRQAPGLPLGTNRAATTSLTC